MISVASSCFPPHLRVAGIAVAVASVLLSGCGGITIRADSGPGAATRQIASQAVPAMPSPAEARPAAQTAAEGLKLARLLRDQARYEAAAELYAQLEQRSDLQPLELLEYATVAARVQSPQDSLALYGRARRALREAGIALQPAAIAALCNGLGRARAALGQADAALADFDCTLAAQPDDVTALNAKGVLLDARGEHSAARELLARAAEIAPADLRILNNLALSYLAAGNSQQASRLLFQATRALPPGSRGPLWPTLSLNLAFIQALQGDDERARQTLEGFMAPAQAGQALADFAQRRQRIRAGASVGDELLAASRQLLPLREKDHRG